MECCKTRCSIIITRPTNYKKSYFWEKDKGRGLSTGQMFSYLNFFKLIPLGSFCPSPLPPMIGESCTAPSNLECFYDVGDHCCCGACSPSGSLKITCDDDLTDGAEDGAKRWKIPICPVTCGDNGEWGPKLVLLFSSPQVWSPHQDSQDDISTTSRRHRQYKGKRGRFWCLTSTTLRYGIVLDASATISK